MSDDASERVGAKLQALYESLPPDEQRVIDFLLQQAADHIGEQADVQGYKWYAPSDPEGTHGHDLKGGPFGAAGIPGGLATPGIITGLVASARDANLFS